MGNKKEGFWPSFFIAAAFKRNALLGVALPGVFFRVCHPRAYEFSGIHVLNIQWIKIFFKYHFPPFKMIENKF